MNIFTFSTVRAVAPNSLARFSFSILFLLFSFLTNAQSFITTWKTDNLGVSNSITIPISSGTYNYDVDWDNESEITNFGFNGTCHKVTSC